MPVINGTALTSVSVTTSAGAAQDIKDETIDVQFGDSNNLLDTTVVSKTEMKRIIGLHDSSLSLNLFVNSDATSTFGVFLTDSKKARTVKIGLASNLFWNGTMLIESTDVSRGSDANLTMSVSMQQADGVAAVWTTS